MTIQQMFLGASPSGASSFNYTISANTTNLNLRTGAIAAGWNGTSALVATINSGVVVYSTSTGSYALTVSGSFPAGVSLINNGTILGKGGTGGAGATVGGNAGPALLVSSAVSITNGSGRIAGGGGGGGGGYSFFACNYCSKAPYCSCGGTDYYGGGGGGGIGNGAAGPVGIYGDVGTAGTLTAAGAGSGGGGGGTTGPSGAGGGYGAAGAAGASGGGGGGAAGAAIVGNSNITWVSTGTRNGSIS